LWARIRFQLSLQNTLIAILLSLGAVQGLVYGMRLLRKEESPKTANQLLACILFFLSYRLLIQVLRLFDLGHYDTWYYFMIDMSWINAPLLYFYVRARVEKGFQWQRKHLLHLIPFVIQVIISVFVRLQNLYWDGTKESLSTLGYYGYAVWMNLPTNYLIASLLIVIYTSVAIRLLKYKAEQLDPTLKQWLTQVMRAFQIYFALVLCTLLIDFFLFEDAKFMAYFYFTQFFYFPFFIGIAGLNYWLGFTGYHKNFKTLGRKPLKEGEESQLQSLADKLLHAMQEHQFYRDPELSLNTLAEKLEVKPYLLSRCFSHVLHVKFNDYINQLRAEEVKRLALLPENNKYTLLSLAFEAGFNSKSSFQRAVRKHLDMSPKELRRAE
jgi:AraC-like DNA-binding protein